MQPRDDRAADQGSPDSRAPSTTPPAGLLPCVGRNHEFAIADDLLAACRDGRGHLLLVSADAGIGKTRLCQELARRAATAAISVHWGRCWPGLGAPPLSPWPDILTTLGLDVGDLAGRGSKLRESERFEQFARVVQRLAHASEHGPLLLILEDVHDAEPGAVLLARLLARRLDQLPIVVVLTWRTQAATRFAETATVLEDLAADGTAMQLGPLNGGDIAELVHATKGTVATPREVLELQTMTAGHPLLVVSMLTSHLGSPQAGSLPLDARRVLDRPLDLLPHDTVEALLALGVFGRSITVAQLAHCLDLTPVALVERLAPARAAGVIASLDTGPTSFTHDLYRARVLERANPRDIVELHSRVAAWLETRFDADRGVGAAIEIAQHALRAALRSTVEAEHGVAAAERAARLATRASAYEQAANWWQTAIELRRDHFGHDEPAAAVAHAEAVLRSGNLLASRQLFEHAVRRASDSGDQVAVAVAALRLGGIWVNEHRTPQARERVLSLQRNALARLPDQHRSLRLRLQARLAAELTYQGAPVDDVARVVELARTARDRRALIESLSLYHHCLLGPDHADRRLAVAEELLAEATEEGDGLYILLALCWRAVDLLLVDDVRADNAVDNLRRQADALQCHHVLYISRCIEVMYLFRQGDLTGAETLAETTFALGTQVGDADAMAYYGAHLVSIRYVQGRASELLGLLETIAASADLADIDHSFLAGYAMTAAGAGDLLACSHALDKLTATGLEQIPRQSTWLATMLGATMAAHATGRTDVLASTYTLLLPYRTLPIRPSLSVACFGSVEWPLGLASVGLGHLDDAIAHFDAAVIANDRFGNAPCSALARISLADALTRRNGPGDPQRAADTHHVATVIAERCGMPAPTSNSIVEAASDPLARADKIDDTWIVTFAGHQVHLRPSTGITYLARLLDAPSQDHSALALVAGTDIATSNAEPVLDRVALDAYRARIAQLREELDDADLAADAQRSERAENELAALISHVAQAAGLRGQSRRFVDDTEHARIAVQKALRRTIARITQLNPVIGDHLAAAVHTGRRCRYEPRDI